MNKDYPKKGNNRKSQMYYYLIKTNKNINIDNIHLTEHEKKGNFKIESIPLNKSIQRILDNISNSKENEEIAPDMICAIFEVLKMKGKNI